MVDIFRKSFKLKIILPAVIILVVLVVSLNVFLAVNFISMKEALVDAKLHANINGLDRYLEDTKAKTRTAALFAAADPAVINAIKERNTNELLRLLTPAYDHYRFYYYTITDHNGIVLARTHDPDNFGDSVIGQQNVQDALSGKVISHFESGTVVKVSVRTGAPVYDADGTLIGVVSAGVRFDSEQVVQDLKEHFQADVTIFLGDTRVATTIHNNGTIVGTTLDPRVAEHVIGQKKAYVGKATVPDGEYKAYYKPLLNSQDEVFAIFFLGLPNAEMVEELNKTVLRGIIFGLCGLAVAIAALIYTISQISQPITEVCEYMDEIAHGNLSTIIAVKGMDEIGRMGNSLQQVEDILHQLISDINFAVAEHHKGNTDYYIDSEKYHGEYRDLVDSIMELSIASMQDQLTGMPNRRSFDNRLILEWNRGMRDKKPLSILVIDVDRFKNYNDTFGHQQGDIALRTIAGAIRLTLNRSVDFSARWGGEEFVVLLPETDAAGAVKVAEKIRTHIENAYIPCDDAMGTKITASIGVNTQTPSANNLLDDFVSTADEALYKAKEAGRNRVVANEEAIYCPGG